jgi:hypothetical protein
VRCAFEGWHGKARKERFGFWEAEAGLWVLRFLCLDRSNFRPIIIVGDPIRPGRQIQSSSALHVCRIVPVLCELDWICRNG